MLSPIAALQPSTVIGGTMLRPRHHSMVLFRQRDSRNIRGGVWRKSAPALKPQPMTDELMTAVQAATLKKLAQDAYELDASAAAATEEKR